MSEALKQRRKRVKYCFLYDRLRSLDLCQQDLADILHISHTAVSNRMTGKTPWDVNEMYRILELCRAKPEELHIYFPPTGGIFA